MDVAQKQAPRTAAYVAMAEREALFAADESDRRRSSGGALSFLDGVPIAVKDNIMVAGLNCTAASNILRHYVAPYDATVVTKMKAAGLVILGKTNLDEFAMGSSTETSCHGPTRNPWDEARVPGGSSGGSATAVAERSAFAALGTDTGGSIRQPAGLCGVVGLKPTYGRVSRYGAIAMASSLDQIGPIGRTVADAAALLEIIEGPDGLDSNAVATTPDQRVSGWPESLKGVRIGLPKEYFVAGMDEEIEGRVRKAVEKLEELGAEIKEVSLPHADFALAAYYIIMPSEVSANLARFDGIRYGSRAKGDNLIETYRKTRGQGFGSEVRRRVMLGTYALSSGYYDAYYLQALKVRRLIAQDFADAFNEVDVLLTPTSPVVAWKLGEKTEDPLAMYLADIYTVPVNIVGLPGVSVPCGQVQGLPVGMQLISRPFEERVMLGVANAYEKAVGRLEFIPSI
ncbi:MAG: Asp-tRNA(Asn)/Glu-tRNA(Gln) amidotransferase subunit GatA [Patescibacteria group bacterium]|nr:Asp-tRNA(Asn)/Glu-tRNA(Gln) amidotransferase subunit GatA [Patescibacteria group bacterium]